MLVEPIRHVAGDEVAAVSVMPAVVDDVALRRVVGGEQADTPYFSSTGIPLSKAARTLERFSLSDDGRRLVLTLTVTDPATFTAPAQAMRAWVARDGEQVMPFDAGRRAISGAHRAGTTATSA